MTKAYYSHLDAIVAGKIERRNIIGLRRMINASERKAHYPRASGTASAVPLDDLYALLELLEDKQPEVVGELHETGLALLRSKRYAKRLAPYAESIAAADHFKLLRFEEIGRDNVVPVYALWSKVPLKGDALDGGTYEAFRFRNIPWQSGGDGPEILEN